MVGGQPCCRAPCRWDQDAKLRKEVFVPFQERLDRRRPRLMSSDVQIAEPAAHCLLFWQFSSPRRYNTENFIRLSPYTHPFLMAKSPSAQMFALKRLEQRVQRGELLRGGAGRQVDGDLALAEAELVFGDRLQFRD